MATPLPYRAASDGKTKELLNPKEAAELMGMRPQTLAAWRSTRRQALPFIRVGRSIRYRLADVMGYLETRTVTPLDLD